MTILTYHSLDTSRSVVSVPPQMFARQMESLDDAGYRSICLHQALDYYAEHCDWPEQSVVVTFDDGYANLHQHALPILRQYHFGATVFVVTGHVGKHNDWAPIPPGMTQKAMLSWDQVKSLRDAGVELGTHTRTHPDLRCLSQPQIDEELAGSRRDLEEQLHCKVHSFAYPFGGVNPVVSSTAATMFRAACTTTLRRANDDRHHHLPRVDMYYFRHCTDLHRLVKGDRDWYLSIRRWARSVKQLSVT